LRALKSNQVKPLSQQNNGEQYNYPATLSEITLKQRIDLHNQYGIAYDEAIQKTFEIESETDKAIRQTELRLLFACQCFSFFTGIDLETIKDTFELSQIMNVYNASLAIVLSEESELNNQNQFEFNGEQWVIASPQVTPQSKFTFNEFVTSKEIVRQLEQLGKGKWASLLYLCCIYLRKEGEEFQEEWMEEGSERMIAMLNVPMNIALSVGFFLTNTMNIYLSTLQSSNQEELKE
jgi:hypothetical protein